MSFAATGLDMSAALLVSSRCDACNHRFVSRCVCTQASSNCCDAAAAQIQQAFVSCHSPCCKLLVTLPLCCRSFLLQVRASALTLAFTLPMVLLGSMAPLIALGFITQTHSLASPAILMILSAVVSGTAVLALELRQVD